MSVESEVESVLMDLVMDDSLEEPWGLLVKEGGEDERVPVLGQEFTIGRSKGDTLIRALIITIIHQSVRVDVDNVTVYLKFMMVACI